MTVAGRVLLSGALACLGACNPRTAAPAGTTHGSDAGPALWRVYHDALAGAKYVDLTHAITPSIPVWPGFGHATFGPSVDPKTAKPYRWDKDGFEATRYVLATDQFGTQLDPPAHWNPNYPAIDELPPTFAVRPLVVISIVDQVAKAPGYHFAVEDIQRWEAEHGRIPEGSVVFVRSDWSKAWPDPALADRRPFPGVSLAALRFLHEQRHILLHGHEPLDTDTTATLEGEDWLLNHGYTQAEGVANLDQVPEAGALVAMGFPKFQGGLGGYARFIAICPPDWKYGVSVGQVPESPLPRAPKPLHWDSAVGMRVR
jgi:kynurenine formamidase